MAGKLSAVWGLAGVFLLLASAVYRLMPLAVDIFSYHLQWHHWLFLAGVLFFMGYAEGYRAFQKGFSPRVVARARYLASHRNGLHMILAPLFCMAYFHAPKRRRITAISVTAGIIVLIILVRLLPQPWRGMIDAGVIVGLAWGLLSIVLFSVQAFAGEHFDYSPEVPDEYESRDLQPPGSSRRVAP